MIQPQAAMDFGNCWKRGLILWNSLLKSQGLLFAKLFGHYKDYIYLYNANIL